MKPATQRDITAANEMLAKLAAKLPEMSPADLVDLGATMKEMARLCSNIADGWEKQSKGETILTQAGCKQLIRPKAKADATLPGSFVAIGDNFRAIFSPYVQTYYATGELAEKYPAIAEEFKRAKPCERVNYKGLTS